MKKNVKRAAGWLFKYSFLVGWLVFLVIMFGWALLASLSTTREIFTNTLLKSGVQFKTYIDLFENQSFGSYFVNSLIYTVTACVGVILVAAPAAYILGRVPFRGRSLINSAFLTALSIPGVLIMIPLFSLFVQLKLTGSIFTLILVYIGTGVPFAIFLLTGFFASIPKELEEAAYIDGCGVIRTFAQIVLPVAQAGLITLSIFTFLGVWNDYFYALIFANNPDTRTIALAMQAIVYGFSNSGNYAGIFATCIIVFLPTFILYIFLSGKIISGITVGSVKG